MKQQDKTGPNAPSFDLLRLDNQLCFALYAATRALTSTYREKLSPMGITYPQYLVLLVLWEKDNITLKEIGHKLMLDSGTLTPLVKRMEAMELVDRTRGTDDERQTFISLKSKGKRLKTDALDARTFVACRLGMTEPEIMALRGDLMELVEHLDDDPA